MITRIKELMTSNPTSISPDATLKEAAQKMESIDCGVLPVGSSSEVQGIITDRDIVLRAVSKGLDVNSERVRDHMSTEVCCCDEDQSPEEVAKLMRDNNVNRLLVKNNVGKISGIITFGRILRENKSLQEITNVIECTVGQKAA